MRLHMTLAAFPLLILAAPAVAAPDGQFVLDAMKGDNSEVSLGHLAMAKGGSAKVRNYGKMLVADHAAHKTKLVALGGKMDVRATDALPADAMNMSDKLKTLDGASFDQAFKQHMIEDHKKDIAKYEDQAKSGQSADVRNLAQQTLPTLRKHLATAQAL